MINEHPDDLIPDPRLRRALLAADRAPAVDIVALRRRILAAAAPPLAARRRPPSWQEVTSRAGRFLIPVSLAAAALAILLLRQVPPAAVELVASQAASTAVAYELPTSAEEMQGLATDGLMPEDADSWLLGEPVR